MSAFVALKQFNIRDRVPSYIACAESARGISRSLLSHTYQSNSPFPTVTDPERDDDVQLHQSPVVRAVLLVLGSLAFVLGIVGLLLPVVPTVPFLLVAAACYARASKRFYRLLLNNLDVRGVGWGAYAMTTPG